MGISLSPAKSASLQGNRRGPCSNRSVPLTPLLWPARSTSAACVGTQQESTFVVLVCCLLYPTTSLPLLQTPGPAAFPKVEVDTYKKRAPVYTMGSKSGIGGDKTVKPGPADYCPGKVRQPAQISSPALQQPALKHLPLPTGLLRTPDHLTGVTNRRTAGLLPCLGPKPSRVRPKNTSLPLH